MKAFTISIFMVLLLPAGSALLAQEEETDEDASNERVCVNVRAIRTFDALTDQHVYVREGSDEHYLFTMQNRCFNLRMSHGIAIKDVTSRICSDGFGEIIYRDRAGGRRPQSCRIDTIERVDSKEAAEELVESREE